jgi:hypothetical protein
MLEYEQLTGVFSKIIANPEDAKQALSDPSSVFTKYGINVPDPEATNKYIFEAVPQLRAHFLAAARSKPHENALLGCDSPGCIACRTGMMITLAPFFFEMFAGTVSLSLVALVADLVGLPTEVLSNLIRNYGNPPALGGAICRATGAC